MPKMKEEKNARRNLQHHINNKSSDIVYFFFVFFSCIYLLASSDLGIQFVLCFHEAQIFRVKNLFSKCFFLMHDIAVKLLIMAHSHSTNIHVKCKKSIFNQLWGIWSKCLVFLLYVGIKKMKYKMQSVSNENISQKAYCIFNKNSNIEILRQ